MQTYNESFSAQAKAWVLFCEAHDKGILRFLKKGFRHCAILFIQDGYAVVVDSLSHRLICDVMKVHDEADLINKIKAKMHVIAVDRSRVGVQASPLSLRPFTCVEVVKHFLGIRRFFIFTPYQLYKFLNKRSEY